MQLSLLHIILSDSAAKAVCWTLVHSTWEGVAAALLAGVIILGTRTRAAALRYNLLTADLLLFLLGAGFTFYYELSRPDLVELPVAAAMVGGTPMISPAASVNTGQATPATIVQPIIAAARPAPSLIQRTESYLNTHAPTITLIWLICLLVQLLRLSTGLYQIDRLRREGVAPDAHWGLRLTLLANRLGIKRTVVLLQSGRVHAPSAIGFLKPAILLPLGLLSRLSPDQVEAILLHELAHIRRSDYLANLLLHLTEAIFFFNPGVRWIAALIRREREACCDDMVLAGTPDRNNYFEALVAFMQFSVDRRSAPAYALQLGGGRKTDLTWRIKRMLTRENKRLHLVEKTILSLGLLAFVSFGTIRASIKPAGPATHPTAKSAAEPTAPIAATATPPAATTATPAAAAPPNTAVAPAVAPMTPMTPMAPIAPVPAIPARHDTTPNKTFSFRSLTTNSGGDEHNTTYHATGIDQNGIKYELAMLDDSITEFHIDGALIPQSDYHRLTDVILEMTARQSHPARPGTPSTPVTASTPSHPGTPGTASTPAIPGTPGYSYTTTVGPPSPSLEAGPHGTVIGHGSKPPYLSTNPVTIDIIHDLQKENLIDRLDEMSFSLTTSEMIINHVKQPDDVFQQFMTKYLKHPGDQVIFSQYFNTKGSGSSEKVIIQ
jgi:bla regulator protein BlaR1